MQGRSNAGDGVMHAPAAALDVAAALDALYGTPLLAVLPQVRFLSPPFVARTFKFTLLHQS